MKSFIVLAVLVGVAVAGFGTGLSKKTFRTEYVNHVNSAQTTWKAKRNFPIDTPYEHFQKLASLRGISADPNLKLPLKVHQIRADLPESFDAAEQWPNCKSINTIRDQGACGSCWAFGAVEAMTDRLCIKKGEDFIFSAEELISCCSECGFGCNGGYLINSWQYWQKHGIVSGGDQNSQLGCKPYTSALTGQTSECKQECSSTYNKSYTEDLRMGVSAYQVGWDEDQIQQEIYDNGPVEVTYIVFEDFYDYASGVYQHVTGEMVGTHAVKIVGWGVENGVKYWKVANSWGNNWGKDGFFKILRGENHCHIESNIVGGLPL